MISTFPPAIFALVSNPLRAESIISEIRVAGFASGDVSVLFPDVEANRKFAYLKQSHSQEETDICVGSGIFLGGMAGWLAGLDTILIPGAEPIVAAGPVAAALQTVAAGMIASGLTGALVGLDFAEEEARFYAGRLEEGNILIAVQTADPDCIKIIHEIFERADAYDIGVTHEIAARTRG